MLGFKKKRRNMGNGPFSQPRTFTFCVLHRLQNLEAPHEGSSMLIYGSRIVRLATVVGSTEERDELPLCEELVAIFHHLMRRAYEFHVVLCNEIVTTSGPKINETPRSLRSIPLGP